jgi:hypothetical protein
VHAPITPSVDLGNNPWKPVDSFIVTLIRTPLWVYKYARARHDLFANLARAPLIPSVVGVLGRMEPEATAVARTGGEREICAAVQSGVCGQVFLPVDLAG